MKCPKCSYIGFETGDRCKNCGYDFSLIAHASLLAETVAPAADISLRASPDEGAALQDLPLFTPAGADDSDEPLIKLPATPRPPLAVRRTPDTPRLRTSPAPKPKLPVAADPILDFMPEAPQPEPPAVTVALTPEPSITADRSSGIWAEETELPPPVARRAPVPTCADAEISLARARMTAAAIDHLLLFGIDIGVLYFTLRMTGLTWHEWSMLPAVPFLAFLLLVKLSYFCAFTAVGGQTIGKMAAHIRVVADQVPLEGVVALKRTLVAAGSTLLLGAGFVPVLFGADRRAFHDRLTHTRVIALPS